MVLSRGRASTTHSSWDPMKKEPGLCWPRLKTWSFVTPRFTWERGLYCAYVTACRVPGDMLLW